MVNQQYECSQCKYDSWKKCIQCIAIQLGNVQFQLYILNQNRGDKYEYDEKTSKTKNVSKPTSWTTRP